MKNIRKQAILITLTIIFALIICGTVSATSYTDIYVSPTGNDSYDGGDPLHPAQTIKHALGVTKDKGSTIHLANGIYSGTGNTRINLLKNMTIKGQSQTGTIINGTNTNWIFYISNDITVTIQNLTLTKGTSNAGGAIRNGGTLKVTDTTFNGNTATLYGGAIYNTDTSTVTGCTFTGNNAPKGGAIFSQDTLTVTSSTFTGNTATNYGGAIYNTNNLTVKCSTFTNNDATGNYPANGGAIYNEKIMTVAGSTFTKNNADYGGAIYNYGGTSTTPVTISSSTFTGNAATHLGGAIYNTVGTVNVYFSRIVGNSASQGRGIYDDGGNADAPFNWWGDNNGPAGKVQGLTVIKWLILTINAASSSVQTNKNSKIIADLRYDNSGTIHTDRYIPNEIVVKFTTTRGTIIPQSLTVNGIAQSTLKAGLTTGIASVLAKLDNQTISKSVNIIDTIAPKVISTYPKKNAKKVSKTKTIIIKFSEKIKKSTKWSKIYVKNKYGKVKITKKWVSGNKIYIKTKKRISKKYYTVYIPVSAVKDYTGNKLTKKYTFKFKTRK
ncbi:Ig-like domain-containing protein [Methanobacterium sp.]|uniref:Ig-like domain-containing protein n=1 Tax=Methanobacterium sp. TaxID=2164 RepID=UPI003C7892D9